MPTFIGYTVGLECRTTRGIKLLKVEYSRTAGQRVILCAVSGRNLEAAPELGKKTLTPEEYDARPHDPCDSTAEAIWALEQLGLRPAALADE